MLSNTMIYDIPEVFCWDISSEHVGIDIVGSKEDLYDSC